MTDTPPPPHEPDPLEPDAAPVSRGPGAVDPTTPLDPVDEAASATIDGLTPDTDASTIDPELLRERVQELTGVTALLAEPVRPPEAGIIDAHIAAALDALPAATPEGLAVEHQPGPAVAPLAARRRRPSAGRWLAVAAAIAVVALAIPVVRSLSNGSTQSHDTAASATADTVAADSSASSPAASPEQAATPTTGFSAAATTTVSPVLNTSGVTTGSDLGTLDTPQQLTAVVAGAVPPESPSSTATRSQVDSAVDSTTVVPGAQNLSCDTANRAGHPDLGALRFTATATYQSVPVEIAVYDVAASTAASARLLVTAVDSCEVLLDRLLP